MLFEPSPLRVPFWAGSAPPLTSVFAALWWSFEASTRLISQADSFLLLLICFPGTRFLRTSLLFWGWGPFIFSEVLRRESFRPGRSVDLVNLQSLQLTAESERARIAVPRGPHSRDWGTEFVFVQCACCQVYQHTYPNAKDGTSPAAGGGFCSGLPPLVLGSTLPTLPNSQTPLHHCFLQIAPSLSTSSAAWTWSSCCRFCTPSSVNQLLSLGILLNSSVPQFPHPQNSSRIGSHS